MNGLYPQTDFKLFGEAGQGMSMKNVYTQSQASQGALHSWLTKEPTANTWKTHTFLYPFSNRVGQC